MPPAPGPSSAPALHIHGSASPFQTSRGPGSPRALNPRMLAGITGWERGAGRGLSPAPESPATGPACPGRGVSSASVSPESAHMPGGGAAPTGNPGVQSSPDVSAALPRSPLPGPQPPLPAPLEDGMGRGVSVATPSASGWTRPWAPTACIFPLYTINSYDRPQALRCRHYY